jgi:predicted dehydrogenase/threonine dehydrogenase-like Zn-dependent dehydrogenase
MKQIIQSFKTGETLLEDIPAPQVKAGTVLIETTRSLVSLGTEKMLVEFGKANLIEKARQQPDKVKQVLDKIKSDGLLPTLEAVFNKLGQPLPLGYCNVGKVVAVGKGVHEFSVGDRVVSNGPHAEMVCVPKNLVAAIPAAVSDEEAAFTVIGSIGLQGIRLLNPTLGETVVVTGLGLIGLIAAELLLANGCKVIGIDIDEQKLAIAKGKGIIVVNPQNDDVVAAVMQHTYGVGADGVLITASAKTDTIISEAARMSRKRGRIVLVGVIGLNISRADFYDKELSFQVSCSYGPGRYDEQYEQQGIDYPLPFVRWTEKRNFETVLQAIASGRLAVAPYITERVPLEQYLHIYGAMGKKGSIASILEYPGLAHPLSAAASVVQLKEANFLPSQAVVGIIGAGNFTQMTLLPALKNAGASLKYIASASGVSGTAMAKKYGFSYSTTDYKQILQDEATDLVMITTRHQQHAAQVIESLQAGKHVFVEKPLALQVNELKEIATVYQGLKNPKTLTVGFNRRFSPHTQKMKQLLGKDPGLLNVVATMNAGFIPPNVWVHDPIVGGGRIVGEACHFIDLIVFLSGSLVKAVCMNAMGLNPSAQTDNASILLQMENGSQAVINYFSNGHKSYSKERLEVYSQNRTLVMDNFRVTEGFGFAGFKRLKTSQNKGHKEQFHRLIDSIKHGGSPLIPVNELVNVTAASFAAIQSLLSGGWVNVSSVMTDDV